MDITLTMFYLEDRATVELVPPRNGRLGNTDCVGDWMDLLYVEKTFAEDSYLEMKIKEVKRKGPD